MPRFIDLTRVRFGRLVAIEESGRTKGLTRQYSTWKCQCDCGKIVVVLGMYLRSKKTQSCGCLQRDRRSESHTTHGKTDARIYRIFHHMRYRCTVSTSEDYSNYGGRGIKVCERWSGQGGFENFLADMGEPEPGMMLERKDNNGNYEPDNCKWATAEEQASNKRNSRKITWNGKTQNLTAWARSAGKSSAWLNKRLKRMPLERAMEPFSQLDTNAP